LGFFAQLYSFFNETLFECFRLLETTPHGAAPLLEEAGAQLAISSPIDAEGRAVMSETLRLILPARESFIDAHDGTKPDRAKLNLGHEGLKADSTQG
jgi:hypothetical protein